MTMIMFRILPEKGSGPAQAAPDGRLMWTHCIARQAEALTTTRKNLRLPV